MKIVGQGTIHRGQVGTNRAVATFPMVSVLNNGLLLAAYKVGPNKDSEKANIELRWCSDLGETWTEAITPFSSTLNGKFGSLWEAFPQQLSSGRLIVTAMWVDRQSFPGQPLFHPETEGFLPMEIVLAESDDDGHTWSPWKIVPTPESLGPPSLTSPLLELPSGNWALSIETNKPYLDSSKWYQRVDYLYSSDHGKTWGTHHTVSQDPTGQMYNWDQRAGVTPDGEIVTFTWYYDSHTGTYKNIQRRISEDEGLTWTDPEDLGIKDQASRPAILGDGRIVLAWVDRFDTQTIRARMSTTTDSSFLAETEIILYDHKEAMQKIPLKGDSTAELLSVSEMLCWTYGLPFATTLPNGEVMVVYYSGSTESMGIDWVRLSCE